MISVSSSELVSGGEEKVEGPKYNLGRRRRITTMIKSGVPCLITLGIPWTKKEFIERAVDVHHPLLTGSIHSAVDSLKALFRILTLGPGAIRALRTEFISMVRRRAD